MNRLTEAAGSLGRAPSPVIQGSLRNIEKYQSERPIGAQETARIWRHAKRDGVELFRGSYTKYQAAHHYHTVPAIGIVAKGAMTSYCRGETHTLPTNTVFLINPEEVHAPGPAKTEGWIFRVFYFEDSFYQKLSRGFGHDPLRFSRVFVKDQELANTLLALHRALESENDTLEIDSVFISIFARLAEEYACDPADVFIAGNEKSKINRVKQYLEEHHVRNLTLEELADVGQLSPYHLLRSFQKAVGLTPHAYLTQIRIEVAMRLLREGKTISDAAFDTGFTDQSHFTRHFKRIMGVTPGQFHARGPLRRISV